MEAPIIIRKKKVHGHAAHHGGSWKVAYADFVTAMMAFFMVMWIMGLSEDTRAQIQGYFNDPVGFMKTMPKSRNVIVSKGAPPSKPGQASPEGAAFKSEQDQVKKLKQDLEKALEKSPELQKLLAHLDIQLTPDGLRIEFLEDKDDFFESGGSVLKPSAVKLIGLLGPKLAESDRSMIIEGHTDSVPFAGDPMGNSTLSTQRALSLQLALAHSGVRPEKFLYVKGLADKELRDPEHPTSSVNRRVTILLPYLVPKDARALLPKDEIRQVVRDSILPSVKLKPVAPNLVSTKK